jgi:hypothetical protein
MDTIEAVELSGLIREGRENAAILIERAGNIAAAFEVLSGDPSTDEVKRALSDIYWALTAIALIQHKVGRAYKTIDDATR